jgi:hypothetical protein
MPQKGRLVGHLDAPEIGRPPRDIRTDLQDSIDVALGVDPARQGQTDEILIGRREAAVLFTP